MNKYLLKLFLISFIVTFFALSCAQTALEDDKEDEIDYSIKWVKVSTDASSDGPRFGANWAGEVSVGKDIFNFVHISGRAGHIGGDTLTDNLIIILPASFCPKYSVAINAVDTYRATGGGAHNPAFSRVYPDGKLFVDTYSDLSFYAVYFSNFSFSADNYY